MVVLQKCAIGRQFADCCKGTWYLLDKARRPLRQVLFQCQYGCFAYSVHSILFQSSGITRRTIVVAVTKGTIHANLNIIEHAGLSKEYHDVQSCLAVTQKVCTGQADLCSLEQIWLPCLDQAESPPEQLSHPTPHCHPTCTHTTVIDLLFVSPRLSERQPASKHCLFLIARK